MRVFLAAQIFSESVAAGMSTILVSKILPPAQFIKDEYLMIFKFSAFAYIMIFNLQYLQHFVFPVFYQFFYRNF